MLSAHSYFLAIGYLWAIVDAHSLVKRALDTPKNGNWYDKDNWRNSDSMTYHDQNNNARSHVDSGSGARPSDTVFDGSGYGPDDEDAFVDASGAGSDDEDTVVEGSGGGIGVVQTHAPVWPRQPEPYTTAVPYYERRTTQTQRPVTTTPWRFDMTKEKDTVPWFEQVVTTSTSSWWAPTQPEYVVTQPPVVMQDTTTHRQDYDVQVGIADPATPPAPPSTPRSKSNPSVTSIYDSRPDLGLSDPLLRPGILAAVIGGAVVGLLAAILLVMFIVYRMRKMDEGSYALEEPNKAPPAYSYAYQKAPTKEFYA